MTRRSPEIGLVGQQVGRLRAHLNRLRRNFGKAWRAPRDETPDLDAMPADARARDVLEQLAASTSEVIFAKDREGRYIFVNPAFCEIAGAKEKQILGRTDHDIFPPETAEVFTRSDWEVLEAGKPLSFQQVSTVASGRRVSLVTKSPYRDESGAIIGIAGISKDITAQFEAEERYRELIETSPDAVYVSQNRKFAFLNESAVRLFGASSPEDLVGRRILDFIDPALHSRTNQRIAAILERGEQAPLLEARYLRVDGTYVDVEATASRIVWRGKDAVQILARDISDRKRAEDILRRQAQIIEQTHEAVLQFSPDGHITGWNRGAERLFGYTAGEALGQHIGIMLPEGVTHDMPGYWASLEERGELEFVVKRVRKSGEVFECGISSSPLRDENGAAMGAVAYCRDVTDHMRAEEALRLQAAVMEQIHEAVVVSDMAGVITGWNAGAERMFGYSAKEASGRHNSFLYPEHVVHDSEEELVKWIDGKGHRETEQEFRRKNGEVFAGSLSLSLLRDDQGIGVGIIAFAIDITARKQAEEALRHQAEVIEQTLDSVVTVDLEGLITSWNRGAERLYGWTAGEAIGRHITMTMPEDTRARRDQDILAPVLERGSLELELKRLCKSGEIFDCEMRLSILRDQHGEPVELIGYSRDISERKQAEEALRRQATFIEQARDAMVSVDLDGLITSWNAAAERDFGWTEKEMLGRHITSTSPDMEEATWRTRIRDRILDLGGLSRAGRRVRKSGEIFDVDTATAVLKDSNDQPVGFVSAIRDLTERKQAEAIVRETEENYRNIFETSPDGIAYSDADGKMTGANQAYMDMLGYSFEELRELNYRDFTPEKYWRMERERNDLVAAKGEPQEYEKEYLRKDGTVFPVNIKIWCNRDQDGNVSRFMARAQDITERRAAEELLRHQAALIEQTRDAIVTSDMEGIVIGWNKGAETLFGWTAEEAIGRHVAMFHADDESPGWHQSALREMLEYGEVEVTSLRKRKSGELFHAEVSISRLENEEGNPVGMIARVQDITARKQAEDEIMEAKEQAEAASQAKSEFLSSMSHELRTPLNAVLGFGQLLQMDQDRKLDRRQQEALASIISGGNQLLSLIDMVLELAKIESGHVQLAFEAIDAGAAVADCLGLVETMASRAGVALVDGVSGSPAPKLWGDRSRVRQVLLNLLSNAIKYNRRQGAVTVGWEAAADSRVRITVADTGRGIAERDRGQIFEPFTRAGLEGSNIEGTGIGLTITRQLVEMMDGRVGFESREGKGSTFWFELPVARARDVAATEDVAADGDKWHRALEQVSGTVLYIEDNPANLALMEAIVERLPGVTLLQAANGETGVEIAGAANPDLVLMDIGLPDMSGYDAMERLKALPGNGDVPVVALSARAMPEEVEKGRAAGFCAYLIKPLKIGELVETLNKYMP